MKQKIHTEVSHGHPTEGKESQEQAKESETHLFQNATVHKNTMLIRLINSQRTWCRPMSALSLLLQSLQSHIGHA